MPEGKGLVNNGVSSFPGNHERKLNAGFPSLSGVEAQIQSAYEHIKEF